MATSVVDSNGGSGGLLVTELGQIKELVRQLEVNLGGSSPDLCNHLASQIFSLTDCILMHVREPSISLRRVTRKRSTGADHPAKAGSSSYNTISSSSRSGTIVSTAYTSGGSASPHSSRSISTLESVFCFHLAQLDLEVREGTSWIIEADKNNAEFAQPIKKPRKTTEETKMKHIGTLVQEFFGRPSANLNNEGGDMNVLERWFTELGVSWVLQLDVGESPLVLGHPRVRIWIQALTRITETIHLTESFFPDHGHGFVGMPGISEEEEVESGKQAATSLDPLQFALFFQKAMAKMLVFVDVMFSKSICIHEGHEPEDTSSVLLNSCLHIHRALSEVLLGIRLQFHSSPPAVVQKIEKEMISLLSAKQDKAFDAIRSFMEERRTRALKSMEDSLCAETPQGSLDIHQATWSVMNHIKFLLYHCWEVDPLFVSKAASLVNYVPQIGLEEAQPFISMIAEMVSCLEEKLITKSQSFIDKGLGLLFLLNNSNFIQEQLQDSIYCINVDLAAVISFITRKVEHYIESYIQESWEPMLACLFNPTPRRLLRKYSPLSKFESEFQKIYTTQKLWKVPNPELRKRLRKAVIQKLIPGYTKYIEDSKVTNPKFTPLGLEEMLQELFEG